MLLGLLLNITPYIFLTSWLCFTVEAGHFQRESSPAACVFKKLLEWFERGSSPMNSNGLLMPFNGQFLYLSVAFKSLSGRIFSWSNPTLSVFFFTRSLCKCTLSSQQALLIFTGPADCRALNLQLFAWFTLTFTRRGSVSGVGGVFFRLQAAEEDFSRSAGQNVRNNVIRRSAWWLPHYKRSPHWLLPQHGWQLLEDALFSCWIFIISHS